MKSHPSRLNLAGVLILFLGFAVSAGAQDANPMHAPSANQGPAQNAPAPSTPQPSPAPTGAPSQAAAATPAPAQPPKQVEVPAGSHIPLVLHNAISTRSARPGDPVYFETVFPIMVDGHVAVPAGSYISGEVTESKRPGRVKGRAELAIRLTTMILPNGYMVDLNAVPSGAGTGGGETVNSEGKVVGDSSKGADAGTVIRSTIAGTAIGAEIGDGTGNVGRGAGIGAGAGAVAGLAAVLLTRGPDATMPRGSTLEAVIDRPIYLDADKVQFTSPGQASALAGPPNRGYRQNHLPIPF